MLGMTCFKGPKIIKFFIKKWNKKTSKLKWSYKLRGKWDPRTLTHYLYKGEGLSQIFPGDVQTLCTKSHTFNLGIVYLKPHTHTYEGLKRHPLCVQRCVCVYIYICKRMGVFHGSERWIQRNEFTWRPQHLMPWFWGIERKVLEWTITDKNFITCFFFFLKSLIGSLIQKSLQAHILYR